VWKEGGEFCVHSNVVSTLVSEDAVNNSFVFHGFIPAALFEAKASNIT